MSPLQNLLLHAKQRLFFPYTFYTTAIVFSTIMLYEYFADPDPVDGGTFITFILLSILAQLASTLIRLLPVKLPDVTFAIISNIVGLLTFLGLAMLILSYDIRIS